ncbi:DUF6912 family protein [Corynebacterium tapiri]|uniref:Uncharacterized protein n=1 Tax=Corynebacterium tapiri TaxID=1448266 RepID=A0A5C4U4C9_9CORY|nr:hypothetical protein [Corynebacterium tapiri]TNL98411.1 hypothetical protein FHE74_04220 [Corynebacterium tapiri]
MRVYVPATFDMLVSLNNDGVLPVRQGWAFAVTPAVREMYTSGDEEDFEAIVFDEAAEASLRLLAIGDEHFPHRRVVVSADVDDSAATPQPDTLEAVVKLDPAQLRVEDIAAVHVDVKEAEDATRRAVEVIDAADLGDPDAEIAVGEAQDHYMAFYDPSELPFLIELM